jgi:hypothetical protein
VPIAFQAWIRFVAIGEQGGSALLHGYRWGRRPPSPVDLRRRGETTESSGGCRGREGWGFPRSSVMSITAA